jgi:hypothetical protein
MKTRLCHSQLFVKYSFVVVSYIDTVYLQCHRLLPGVDLATQFVWFLMANYPFIFSHPIHILIKPEPLFVTNSLQIS